MRIVQWLLILAIVVIALSACTQTRQPTFQVDLDRLRNAQLDDKDIVGFTIYGRDRLYYEKEGLGISVIRLIGSYKIQDGKNHPMTVEQYFEQMKEFNDMNKKYEDKTKEFVDSGYVLLEETQTPFPSKAYVLKNKSEEIRYQITGRFNNTIITIDIKSAVDLQKEPILKNIYAIATNKFVSYRPTGSPVPIDQFIRNASQSK